MNLSAQDRIALILGRAIIRAEGLQAELEQTKAELEQFRAEVEAAQEGLEDPR